jgi:hypothetical protein
MILQMSRFRLPPRRPAMPGIPREITGVSGPKPDRAWHLRVPGSARTGAEGSNSSARHDPVGGRIDADDPALAAAAVDRDPQSTVRGCDRARMPADVNSHARWRWGQRRHRAQQPGASEGRRPLRSIAASTRAERNNHRRGGYAQHVPRRPRRTYRAHSTRTTPPPAARVPDYRTLPSAQPQLDWPPT